MFNIVMELILAYIQFLSVPLEARGTESTETADGDSDYPSEWSDPMYFLSFFNLNLDIIGDVIVTVSDIRVYFMILAVVIPILMVFFGLFFLSKKRVVIWYFFTVIFFMTLIIGAFARVVTESDVVALSARSAEILMYVGFAGLVTCWLIFLCGYKGLCGVISESDEKSVNRRVLRERETQNCNGMALLERFVAFLVVVVGGITVYLLRTKIDDNTTANFAVGLAGCLFFLGLLVLIWIFMGFCQPGRAAQWSVNEYFRQTFLKLLLLLMSTLYIPIGTTVFTIFNCNTFTCPSGYRLPDDKSIILLNSSVFGGECVPCQFASSQTCPSSILQTACAGSSDDRLEYNVAVECARMKAFFWPAAVLIILMYLVGVPALFFQLIRVSGAMMQEGFPIKELVLQEDEKDADFQNRRWLTKVRSCDNSARFLFQPFEYKYRYARLFQLIQKLIVVGTSVYVFRGSLVSPRIIAVSASFSVHTVATILFMISTPFIILLHDIIAGTMSLVLSVTSLVAILVLTGVNVPSGILIAIIVLCVATPVAAFVIGVAAAIYNCRVQKEEEEAETESRVRTLEEVERAGDLGAKRATRRNRFLTSRVKVELDKEQGALQDAQHDFDVHIDNRVQKNLRVFLMIGGIIGILAFGCCFLGLWNESKFAVVNTASQAMTVDGQFGGYESWDNFTSSCCCTYVTNGYDLTKTNGLGTEYVSIEKWICDNGGVVERPRSVVLNNGTDMYIASATSVRDVCSSTFATGCVLDESDPSALSVTCGFTESDTEKRLW